MDRQKLFDWTLKIFLFLSPIFFFKEYQPSFAKGLFFVMGTFALFGVALGLEPRRKFSDKWLSLFLLLAFVRVFFDNAGSSSAEWFNFWMSCAGFIYVFCGVLLFYLVYCYADRVEKYLKPIILVCILNALLAGAQLLNADFFWHQTTGVSGFMAIDIKLGTYSAMSLPILFCINPFLAIIPLFTLLISTSFSALIVCLAGIVFFSVSRGVRKVLVIGLIAGIVLIGLLNYGFIQSKLTYKTTVWRKTVKSALQKPYLGWGYRSFSEKVSKITGDTLGALNIERSQNDYLHTTQELGFPIMIVIAMFFMNLFRKFIAMKNKDKLTICLATSVFMMLINMTVQPVIRYASIAGTWIILLAFLEIKLDGHQI